MINKKIAPIEFKLNESGYIQVKNDEKYTISQSEKLVHTNVFSRSDVNENSSGIYYEVVQIKCYLPIAERVTRSKHSHTNTSLQLVQISSLVHYSFMYDLYMTCHYVQNWFITRLNFYPLLSPLFFVQNSFKL